MILYMYMYIFSFNFRCSVLCPGAWGMASTMLAAQRALGMVVRVRCSTKAVMKL